MNALLNMKLSFKLLKELTISNSEAQHQSRISEYPYLIELHLVRIHDDYAEQFLFDTKTCLSNSI